MSFEALARIRDVQAPSSNALLVLYLLAEYAGADGTCYSSQALLAERAQLSPRTVRAMLAHLRKSGLIGQQQRRRKDGSRTTDLITLLYYTPEQAADPAACEIAKRPTKARETLPSGKRQNSPLAKRQTMTGPAAPVAGLTSFEPVTETVSLSAREPQAAEADAQLGCRDEGAASPVGKPDDLVALSRLFHAEGLAELDIKYLGWAEFDRATRTVTTRTDTAAITIDRDSRARRLLRDQGISLRGPRWGRSQSSGASG